MYRIRKRGCMLTCDFLTCYTQNMHVSKEAHVNMANINSMFDSQHDCGHFYMLRISACCMFVHFRGIVRHAKTVTPCMFVLLHVHKFCMLRVFARMSTCSSFS
jgi:hypothetical protein